MSPVHTAGDEAAKKPGTEREAWRLCQSRVSKAERLMLQGSLKVNMLRARKITWVVSVFYPPSG